MRRVRHILYKIFEGHPRDFEIKLWDGHVVTWGKDARFTLIFRDKNIFKKIILTGDALTCGSAFIENKIDIEGDVLAAVKLGDYLSQLRLNRREKLKIFAKLLTL